MAMGLVGTPFHTKHKGRLIHLQEFPHWVFLFHFSAAVLCTRQLVIYSFMLLQALHVEIEMKNLNPQVTLLVQKSVGTPFPLPLHPCVSRLHYTPVTHYTPAGRSNANQQSSLAQPAANLACFILSLPDMQATFYGQVCCFGIYAVIERSNPACS